MTSHISRWHPPCLPPGAQQPPLGSPGQSCPRTGRACFSPRVNWTRSHQSRAPWWCDTAGAGAGLRSYLSEMCSLVTILNPESDLWEFSVAQSVRWPHKLNFCTFYVKLFHWVQYFGTTNNIKVEGLVSRRENLLKLNLRFSFCQLLLI